MPVGTILASHVSYAPARRTTGRAIIHTSGKERLVQSTENPAMYGLSKDIDLSFLNGRELIQVAIGVYQIQFGFDEDVRISVESYFSHFDGHGEWIWRPEPGAAQIAARTVALLGARIQSFQAHENGTLILTFLTGQRLTILDNSKEYESYDITRPGLTIVV